MSKKIRVAIAEDHELIRQCFVQQLSEVENFEIVTNVKNGSLLMHELRHHTIDIVLMDIDMPVMGGKEALISISQKYPRIKVIMLSMYYSNDFIVDFISSGARGFLTKNCDLKILIAAINAVHNLGYYFDDKMSRVLLSQVLENKNLDPKIEKDPLTKREVEIVQSMCVGKTNKEIANQFDLSVRTVETHRKHIARKTNSTNVAGVVVYAIKNGLFQI